MAHELEPPALGTSVGRGSASIRVRGTRSLQHTVPSLLSLNAVLLVPAAIAAWRSTQRLFWLAVASAVVLPPLVFMNLYVNHDYYPAAISPAVRRASGAWVAAGYGPSFGRGGSSLRCRAAALLLAWGTLKELRTGLLAAGSTAATTIFR